MKSLDVVATVLVIIGALNWGIVGLFHLDPVDLFFERAWLDRCIYDIFGLAGLFKVIYWFAGKWTVRFSDNE